MRFSGRHVLRFGWALVVFAGVVIAAETAPPSSGEHNWKPLVDLYPPDLKITKIIPRSVEQSELRIQMGDDPRWAARDWDDSTWTVIQRKRIPLNAGIFWLRVRIRTGGEERIPALVEGGASTAEDFFWDGVLINSRGTPGNSRETEIVGTAERRFELPEKMSEPGEHVIALRVSTYRSAKVGVDFSQLSLFTVPPEKFRELDGRLNLWPAMSIGAMLTIAIAAFMMWWLADRRLILILFSMLCLSGALLVAATSAPYLWNYPAAWIDMQRSARAAFALAVTGLMIVTTIVQVFPSLRRRWLAVPFLVGATTVHLFPPSESLFKLDSTLWRMALATTVAIAVLAVWRRREGAWPLLAGSIATFAFFERDPKHFEVSGFLVGFLPLLIGLISGIALHLRRERLEARDTKLTAARLEVELLKKSIQPHFLMNTLTALSQVVEEKPAAAVQLIEDLAAEFRSLSRFAGEKQVSIDEELTLCRAHLRVMSARTELAWSLVADGIDMSARVPPALFLTLIENGFSHQDPIEHATVFTLRAEPMGQGMRYTFVSPGLVTEETTRGVGGTGLRYVRARLEESFAGAWRLSQGAVAGGWETVIELPQVAAAG